jgi:hypothetical protein
MALKVELTNTAADGMKVTRAVTCENTYLY